MLTSHRTDANVPLLTKLIMNSHKSQISFFLTLLRQRRSDFADDALLDLGFNSDMVENRKQRLWWQTATQLCSWLTSLRGTGLRCFYKIVGYILGFLCRKACGISGFSPSHSIA